MNKGLEETKISTQVQLFLLSSIGLITLPHALNIPTPLFVFFLLLLGWRFAGIWYKNLLPGSFVVFFMLVIGILLLVSQHQGILGRDAGTSLFITALALKLLEIKKQRDIYLIIYLAFIVAATEFLYLQNIAMAGYILAVSCVLIATLICINSQKPRTLVAIRTSAIIIMQAIPVMVAVFILFPRVEAPKWMLFQNDNSAITGLSDSLEPGAISKLGLSRELAFRVKFDGDIPPRHQRYWRGPVFSVTDGKRWTQSKNVSFEKSIDQSLVDGKSYQYTIMMEPQTRNWIYALEMPTEFPDSLTKNYIYQLITKEDPSKRAEYKITSFPSYRTGNITQTDFRENVQLPGSPSERIHGLVDQLQGFKGSHAVFIANVLDYFRQEEFYYTLFPPLMKDNPVETFLFDARYGFCSHYATAFVYLMRVAGIPARVIGGYQGGELNELGDFLEIRQANAHAWAEVWLENVGWQRVDPTAAIAPERIEQGVNINLQIANGEVNFTPFELEGATLNWLRRARGLWSSLDYGWQRWVIGYNSINQARFLASFGIKGFYSMAKWLLVCIACLTGIIAWFLLRNKHKKMDKVGRAYNRFCNKMAKSGVHRNVGEGARDFAVRAKATRPDLTEKIDRITSLFIKIRYGRNSTTEDVQELIKRTGSFRIGFKNTLIKSS